MLDAGLAQAYTATLTLAVLPIVLGSFGSLQTSRRSRRLLRERGGKMAGEANDDEDDDDLSERISLQDAYWFPVLGSCMLLGLYLIFKYVDKAWINWFIGWYFTLTGVMAVWETGSTIITYLTPSFVSSRLPLYTIKISDQTSRIASLSIPFLSLLMIPAAGAVPYSYIVLDKPWWANNIMGFSFAHNAVMLMKLDSFLTGSVLLGGLFFYDIFWVFGTDVMVSVATGLEAPVKLIFPKDQGLTRALGFTMLGLGDIVIPGVFIALALRYDFSLAARRNPSHPYTPSSAFPKPYFYATMVAYVTGLVTTIVIMHTFHSAQPALLYLSPACVGSVGLVALARGEWEGLWKWQDGEDDELEAKGREAAAEETDRVVGEVAEKVDGLDGDLGEGEGINGEGNGNAEGLRLRSQRTTG